MPSSEDRQRRAPRSSQTPKPSLDLLRSLSDEHVLRAVMDHGRLTRADIAARTGISKPTVSESARRLTEAGVLVDTGERTTGRGRAGSYYTLAEDVGTVLVCAIRPDGVMAESVDPFGGTVAAAKVSFERQVGTEVATRALDEVASRAQAGSGAPFRLAVVSAADPVDRETGRLIHLPDAPFMVGDLDPVSVLRERVEGRVHVDNDVNWAARAEQEAAEQDSSTFVYIHLGEGLGCAVMADGEVSRGHRGVAGEIAHIVVPGPAGRAMAFTEVFAALGLRKEGSTAIDVDRLRAAYPDVSPDGATTLEILTGAVRAVLAAAVALVDPERIVLGGTWGQDPEMVTSLAASVAEGPRPVPVVAAAVQASPDWEGARAYGLEELRTSIATRSRAASA